MEKLHKNLTWALRLQSFILGYFVMFLIFAVYSWFFPLSNSTVPLLWIFVFSLFLMIPFALFVLAFSLKVFRNLAKADPTQSRKVQFASWFSLFTGIVVLAYYGMAVHRSQWDSPVLEILSPVILGLALLASHIHLSRGALRAIGSQETISAAAVR
jgi:hypothetical protein